MSARGVAAPSLYQRRLRPALRHAALDALAVRERFRGVGQGPGVHFIYLHSVGFAQQEKFRWLLRTLKSRYTVVSYSEAVALLGDPDVDRPYACVSFDDGFASCMSAARILREEGLSACFFVCSALTGMPRSSLEAAFPAGLADETRTMTWDEISGLLSAGHEVGSHTRSHPVLSQVGADQLRAEIFESKLEIGEALEIEVRHFAWPRGRFHHFTPEGAELVREAGYASCASAERGSHAPAVHASFPCIRREHISLDWPRRHIDYFLRNGSRGARVTAGSWPVGWAVAAR